MCESDSESGEDIFTGVCSFSVSAREQYGEEGGEDDEDEDEAREGLAARDARHLVWLITRSYWKSMMRVVWVSLLLSRGSARTRRSRIR